MGYTVLREIGGIQCRDRDWGNTVLRESLGNIGLKEKLGEQCTEREIGRTLCLERDWGTL